MVRKYGWYTQEIPAVCAAYLFDDDGIERYMEFTSKGHLEEARKLSIRKAIHYIEEKQVLESHPFFRKGPKRKRLQRAITRFKHQGRRPTRSIEMYLREVVMHCRGTLALQLGVRAHSECVAIKALTEGHFGKPTSEIAAYALPISPLPIYTIDRILWYADNAQWVKHSRDSTEGMRNRSLERQRSAEDKEDEARYQRILRWCRLLKTGPPRHYRYWVGRNPFARAWGYGWDKNNWMVMDADRAAGWD